MNHQVHVNLLRPADLPMGGIWADLGAGSGAFTLALREILGPEAVIFAVDRDGSRLADLGQFWQQRFGDASRLHILQADFARPMPVTDFSPFKKPAAVQGLPLLDGILMANSLHFFKEKEKLLGQIGTHLKPAGALLLVEYNVDAGNPWVPQPLSFDTWRDLAPRAGFSEPRLLSKRPSSFLREIYSAVAFLSTKTP